MMFKWAAKCAVNEGSGLARNNIVIKYVVTGIKLIKTECRISMCEHHTHVCKTSL